MNCNPYEPSQEAYEEPVQAELVHHEEAWWECWVKAGSIVAVVSAGSYLFGQLMTYLFEKGFISYGP